jgi:hypothetical protein
LGVLGQAGAGTALIACQALIRSVVQGQSAQVKPAFALAQGQAAGYVQQPEPQQFRDLAAARDQVHRLGRGNRAVPETWR